MADNQTEMRSLIMSTFDLPFEDAERLLVFLTEQEYIKLEPNQQDTDRTVFLSRFNNSLSAVSYKLSNIEFNFKKAALSAGIDAIETYLNIDALLKGNNPILHLLLTCLKVISNVKTELDELDAELIDFLWEARLHRRLNVDDEYEAFSRRMVQHGKTPLTSIDYNQALERLEKLRVIKLEDGMIFLREHVVMNR